MYVREVPDVCLGTPRTCIPASLDYMTYIREFLRYMSEEFLRRISEKCPDVHLRNVQTYI